MNPTLYSIWTEVLHDRNVPAHDIIPEAMRRVAGFCAKVCESERLSILPVAHDNTLRENLMMAQVLTNCAKTFRALETSSYTK